MINTSSSGNRQGRVDLDDLEGAKRFSGTRAYTNAKLEQILHTHELDRRYRSQGLTGVSFNPGNIRSSFSQQPDAALKWVAQNRLVRRFVLLTPERGADTLVFLAEGTPGTDFPSGKYFVKRKPTRTNKQADDTGLAAALWDRSMTMIT